MLFRSQHRQILQEKSNEAAVPDSSHCRGRRDPQGGPEADYRAAQAGAAAEHKSAADKASAGCKAALAGAAADCKTA